MFHLATRIHSVRILIIALALVCLASWTTLVTHSRSERATTNSGRKASALERPDTEPFETTRPNWAAGAAGKPATKDTPVTTTIDGLGPDSVPTLRIQSDQLGAYKNVRSQYKSGGCGGTESRPTNLCLQADPPEPAPSVLPDQLLYLTPRRVSGIALSPLDEEEN